jgi:hypothetical protein
MMSEHLRIQEGIIMSNPREFGEDVVREPTNSEEPAGASLREPTNGEEREPTNTEEIVREPTNDG